MLDHRRVTQVLRYTDFVSAHWADLHEARIPGTRRRWAQTRTRAESRRHAGMDGSGIAGLTKAPAPLHLDVLDTIIDVRQIAQALASAVARPAGICPWPALAGSTYAGPRGHLWLVTEHLADAAQNDPAIIDDALNPHHDTSISRARNRTATALRLVLSGQILDCECPWCGSQPMRIEEHADTPLVVCRSRRVCEPPEADCGTWVRGRPAWTPAEWQWLARQIDHARERQSA